VNPPLFLTPTELAELTGRVRQSAQLRWLRGNGWRASQAADGSVRVAREHFVAMMVGGDCNRKQREIEPNWEALDNAATQKKRRA
jgi:hypothetical protein